MQKSISKAAITWRLILSGFIVISLISCEDTNTVGGGVVEPVDIIVDTLYVNDFEQQQLDIFSGGLTNLPMGKYTDPLFGDFEITGYIKPALLPNPTDSLDDSTELKLLLTTNLNRAYGDTTEAINFSIYKVTQRWRENEALATDNIAYDNGNLLGSFTYLDQDSIIIDISESYLLEYAEYVNNEDDDRDSLYNFEFFGLAIVPDAPSSQILFPSVADSKFLTIKETDTVSVPFRDHAFTVDRANEPVFNDKLYLNNFLESFYRISFDEQASGIDPKNILKADLYLYEDSSQMENSLPANHTRPAVEILDLRYANSQDLRYDLQLVQPDFVAFRDTLDNSFKFDITQHINSYLFGEPSEKEFYLTLGVNGGILNASTFYDSSATISLRPKIILTIASE